MSLTFSSTSGDLTSTAPTSDIAGPLLWVFLDGDGAMVLYFAVVGMMAVFGLIYVKYLRLRLKHHGRISRSKVEAKFEAGGFVHHLYFKFYGALQKKDVNKGVYHYFNENDEIEIISDPKCPLYCFEINTRKIPKDTLKEGGCSCKRPLPWSCVCKIIFVMIAFLGGALFLTWGWLRNDKNLSEIIVYYLCVLMWAIPIGVILFPIVILVSCCVKRCDACKDTNNVGHPSNPLLKTQQHVQME